MLKRTAVSTDTIQPTPRCSCEPLSLLIRMAVWWFHGRAPGTCFAGASGHVRSCFSVLHFAGGNSSQSRDITSEYARHARVTFGLGAQSPCPFCCPTKSCIHLLTVLDAGARSPYSSTWRPVGGMWGSYGPDCPARASMPAELVQFEFPPGFQNLRAVGNEIFNRVRLTQWFLAAQTTGPLKTVVARLERGC